MEQTAHNSIEAQAYALGRIYRLLSDLLDREPSAATITLAAERPLLYVTRLMALAHKGNHITLDVERKLDKLYDVIDIEDWPDMFAYTPLDV